MYRQLRWPLAVCLAIAITAGCAVAELVAHWKFDEGSGDIAFDSSGNDYHATLVNSPDWVPGKLGFSALNMEAGGYGGIQGLFYQGSGIPEVSVCAWIRTSVSAGRYIASFDRDQYWRLEINGSGGGPGQVGWDVWTDAGQNDYGSVMRVDDGEWHHVCGVFDNGTSTIYIDGEPEPSQTLGSTMGRNNLRYGYIGKNSEATVENQADPTGNPLDGDIDDLRIYDNALTRDEIAQVMTGVPPHVAFEPSPADKDPDVPYYVNQLNWSPGDFARTHRVYYSVSFDDVNDVAASALIAEGLTESSLEIPTTELGTTYYWRVDEVNGAPDFAVFPGDVWTFSAEAAADLITHVTATANSQFTDRSGPENTVNGSGLTDGLHGIAETDMWLSARNMLATIQFDFDRSYSLHEMHVWNQNQLIEPVLGFGAKGVILEVSSNGADFTVVDGVGPLNQGPGLAGYAANTTLALKGVQAKSVRMTITSGHGFIGQVGLSEVQFTSIPAFPRDFSPVDGSELDDLDLTLSWRAGRFAAEHRVLVGDRGSIEDGSAETVTTAEKSLALADPDYGLVKYWQVIDLAADGTRYPSDIMYFFTPGSAAIDDMERYRDREDFEIWVTWIDGFDDPANGSLVGNGLTGTAETGEVYEGRQSLPMAYDLASASFAEATQAFSPALDLTVGAPADLGIYFQGDPNNGAASVHLTVTDTAGQRLKVSHPNRAATQLTDWTLLSVAIGDLNGVNVSGIRSITLSIEGAGATGRIFADYLHLSRPYQPAAPVEVSSDGLIVHYEFEGDGSDSAGENHGILFGNATIAPDGKIGQGLNLDIIPNVNDVNVPGYVAIDNFFYAESGLPEVTVALWVRVTGQQNQVLVSFDRNEYWRLEINGSGGGPGQVGWDVMTSTGQVDYGSVVRVDDGQWHHVAGVFDRGALRLYIDGAPQPGARGGDTFGRGNVRYGYIGTGSESTAFNLDPRTPASHVIGDMDDVRIYHRALSPAEISWLASP